MFSFSHSDDIYRVPLMSSSGSDYINASFINVSSKGANMMHYPCSTKSLGIQAERCLHSDSGTTGEHSGGLLEDDVGVPVWLYCDAVSAGRRWPGL